SAKDAMLLSRSPYLVMAGALLACQALGGREIVVGVAGGALAGLVATALRAEPNLRRLTRVVDRKSTRLYSSHEWISYAVFCLKKKKGSTEDTSHSERRVNGAEDRLLCKSGKARSAEARANHL